MKKNIIVLLLIINFIVLVVYSQQELGQRKNSSGKNSVTGSLNGTVVDGQTGTALSGATIFIHDIKVLTITGNDGNYRTASVPTGIYLVEVSFVGYKSVSEDIYINGETKHDFKLEQNYTEAGEVVVTGVSKATQIKRNPVPVVSVTHDYLIRSLSTN